MKIEWLNDDFTRARLTRGWFRKKCAEVVLDTGDGYKTQSHWIYATTGYQTSWQLDDDLTWSRNKQIHTAKERLDWKPVQSLPQARLLSKPK